MLVKYKKKSKIGAAIWLTTLVALLGIHPSRPGIFEAGSTLRICAMLLLIWAWWYTFWAYALAKGRSGMLGVALGFLSVIGLVILIGLEDMRPDGVKHWASRLW
jgi:NO-binding membrane sensor protein with MHYT domain